MSVIGRSRFLSPGRHRTLTQENDTHSTRLDNKKLGSRKEDTKSDWEQKASQQIELEKRNTVVMPQH
jgi:hypothetical protein